MSEQLANNEQLERPGNTVFAKVDIPIDVRLTFTDRGDQHGLWLHGKAIGDQIGTSENQVIRIANFLGIPREQNSEGLLVYPPYAQAVINEELQWRESYHQLPPRIRMSTIVERTGRSYVWTAKTVQELGVSPVRSELESGRVIELYAKGVLKELRQINMAVPMDDGWYNLRQLVEYTGADREWIENRLTSGERRRSAITGKIYDYYPPESLQIVLREIADKPQPGGEWLTAYAISMRVDRSENWIRNQLEAHASLAVMRLDDNAVARPHYSPQIVRLLQQESNRRHALPEKADYLSLKEVARKLGHASLWAATRINELGISPEERIDKKGRPNYYYSPTILSVLTSYEASRQADSTDPLLESLFCLGSLKSQLRANQAVARTLRSIDRQAGQDQLQILARQRKLIYQNITRQLKRHEVIINQADQLPKFITGENDPE